MANNFRLFTSLSILLAIGGCSGPNPAARAGGAKHELDIAVTPQTRFYALGPAAKSSFDAGNFEDARKYAQELQAMTASYKGDWNYGNAVQDFNLVFGRLALRDNKIAEAEAYLIAAGKSPGSPQMDSFGPNVSLAQELLARGQTKVVLEYFEECRKFWSDDFGKLNEWEGDVKAGRTPRFGANLVY